MKIERVAGRNSDAYTRVVVTWEEADLPKAGALGDVVLATVRADERGEFGRDGSRREPGFVTADRLSERVLAALSRERVTLGDGERVHALFEGHYPDASRLESSFGRAVRKAADDLAKAGTLVRYGRDDKHPTRTGGTKYQGGAVRYATPEFVDRIIIDGGQYVERNRARAQALRDRLAVLGIGHVFEVDDECRVGRVVLEDLESLASTLERVSV